MIKKRETCLYCGEKMESMTAKKKFCSPLHKLYWHREFKRGTLEAHQLEDKKNKKSGSSKPTNTLPSDKKEPINFKPLTLAERIAALEKS